MLDEKGMLTFTPACLLSCFRTITAAAILSLYTLQLHRHTQGLNHPQASASTILAQSLTKLYPSDGDGGLSGIVPHEAMSVHHPVRLRRAS